jgi:hypothetical protein
VTARNGMTYNLQTRRLELYFGQQDYESLWIAYWLFCGLNWEPWAQLPFSDMICELSCPFSEKTTYWNRPIFVHLTTQLNCM